MIERWLQHIRVLAETIGPRGSTTVKEREAAIYCAQQYDTLGLSPVIETFRSAVSIYHPHVLAGGSFFLAFTIYPLAPILAAALALTGYLSILLELGFIDNPIRRLVPKGESQNVIATLDPAGEHRSDLVLIGHLDSHRTPWIFRSQRWLDFYKGFTTAAFVVFSLLVIGFIAGAILRAPGLWGWLALAMPFVIVYLVLVVQADLTPFSPGANDNASAAGLLLTLAEHFKSEPLQHTRLWLVNTGCEEVGHYGAIDFFAGHKHELKQPSALVFEMLGCAGPAWLEQEGIIVPFRADQALVETVAGLAAEHPEWQAHGTRFMGGNTEMADALRVKVPAITFIGADAQGRAPYWHQPIDRADKMDAAILARAWAMTTTYIRALDGRDHSRTR